MEQNQNFNRRENDNREQQQAQKPQCETQKTPIYKNKWVIGGSVLAIAAAVGTTLFVWKKRRNKKAKKAEELVPEEGANFEGVK